MTISSPIAEMSRVAGLVDLEIRTLLPERRSVQPLAEAMHYPVDAGGKRFRPFLVHQVGQLLGVEEAMSIRLGAAVELLHTYSLVHDDLPAMDDALMRRGQPSCHLAFDEATAILVGDALLALSFEAICRDDWPASAEQRAKLAARLAFSAGGEQLCAGQMMDLQSAGNALDLQTLRRLQSLKTGALIRFCSEGACILASASKSDTDRLCQFGDVLGAAFQIRDDLLDALGNSAETGKDLGRDSEQDKATFVACLGVEGSKTELDAVRAHALLQLTPFGDEAEGLRQLFDFVVSRSA